MGRSMARSSRPARAAASSSRPGNRRGGPTQLVLAFDANIVKASNFAVSLNDGTVSNTSVSGSMLTINLSGVADAESLLVTLSDIRHFSDSSSGNYTLNLGVLLAD